MQEAWNITECHPVRGAALHVMIGLAASTGLRCGGIVRLDNADVDRKSEVLLIKRTKFRKDHYVPMHPTTPEVMRGSAALRDSAYPDCRSPAFFVTMRQRRFALNTLQHQFGTAARRAGLRRPTGRGLSFHDLRHRFAVKRLVAWYEAGIDVHTMLPVPATCMGQVHYSSTACYLTAAAELLGLAAEPYERAVGTAGAEPWAQSQSPPSQTSSSPSSLALGRPRSMLRTSRTVLQPVRAALLDGVST